MQTAAVHSIQSSWHCPLAMVAFKRYLQCREHACASNSSLLSPLRLTPCLSQTHPSRIATGMSLAVVRAQLLVPQATLTALKVARSSRRG